MRHNLISRRTLLAGLAAAATASTLGACGSSSGTASGGSGGSGPTGAAVLPKYIPFTGVSYDLPGEPGRFTSGSTTFPKPIKMVQETPGDGKPFKVWSFVHENPPGRGDNQFWQDLDKRLGSPYEPVLSLTPDYATKFPTLLASGNLPDMFPIPTQYPGVGKLLNAAGADLTEHLAGDAIAEYPALANISTESWRGCIYDGKIRTVPIPRGLTSTWVMTTRQDILDQEGMPKSPSSYREFRDMAAQLTRSDGSRWAIGASPLDYLRSMMSIPRYFVESGGSFTSAYAHEGQQDALEAARDLYASGFIIPDAIGQHANQSKQWLVAGQTAMTWDTYSGFLGFFFTMGVPQGNLNMFQVPDWDGKGQGTAQLGEPNNIQAAITNVDPGRVPTLLKIANYLATPFGTEEYLFRKFGVEGVNYSMDGNTPVPITAKVSQTQVGQAYLIDGPAHLYYTGLGSEVKRMQEHMKTLTKNASVDPSYGLYSETRSGDGPALENEILATSLDIIAGRKPVSAWSAAVKTYLDGGGTKICEELTEAKQNAGA